MASKLPSQTLQRARITQCRCHRQVRYATFLRRPHRPYTFTQLVTLSDGSTYTQRTTSPQPVYKSTKDTRNHPLWQPSLDSLRNVEQDEAGRLKAFRDKFGRGWDIEATQEAAAGEISAEGGQRGAEMEEESLMDLISGAADMSTSKEVGGQKRGSSKKTK